MLQVFKTSQLFIQDFTADPPADSRYDNIPTVDEVVTYLKQSGSAVFLRRDAADVVTVVWKDPTGVWARTLKGDVSRAKYRNTRHAILDAVNAPRPDTKS